MAFHLRADSGPRAYAGWVDSYVRYIDLQLSQETPASWKCVQSWSPHLLAGQSAIEFSVPLHRTLSRRMTPLPKPLSFNLAEALALF